MAKIKSKGNLFFILFLLKFNVNFCQIFGLIQKNPPNYYTTVLPYPSDGNYRVLNCKYQDLAGLGKKYQILVYSANLNLIDSVNLPTIFSYNLYGPIKVANKLIWAGAQNTVNPISNHKDFKGYILLFDSLYQFQTKYLISTDTNAYSQSITPYVGGYFWHQYIYNPITDLFNIRIYKLNKLFLKLDSIDIAGRMNQVIVRNNKIEIVGVDMPSPCTSVTPINGAQRKLEIDTNFNILNCIDYFKIAVQPIPETTTLNNYTINVETNPLTFLYPLSDTKYFLLGTTTQYLINNLNYSLRKCVVNSVLGNNDKSIKTKILANYDQHITYFNQSNEVDFNNKNIISLATEGFNPFIPNQIQNQKTKILVHKLDTLGNTIWVKKYGGDMFYLNKSISFTKDGGCIIAGIRYDSTSAILNGMTNIAQSFLLKLDSNGNYNAVGLFDTIKKIKNFKCFPNPSTNELFFDIPFEENITIEIFDLFGRSLKLVNNYKNYSALDLTGLNEGNYFYNIKTNTNLYYGKFVKLSE